MDVFLLGAGASAPLGLPVTRGFLSDFSPTNNLVPFYNSLKDFAGVTVEKLDIEFVFDVLQKLSSLRDSFLIAYFKKLHYKDSYKICAQAIPSVIQIAENLLFELKSFVVEKVRDFSSEKAFELFFHLFKKFISPEKPLIIFTTNYDLVLEEAFTGNSFFLLPEWRKLGLKKLYIGFEFRDLGAIFNLDRAQITSKGVVSILKLHGSINWRPHGDTVVLGGKDKPENPDDLFLIYPGYKSIPDREPFASLHLAFLEVLSRAERLISVGFAFRDFYINSILHHVLALNQKLRIYALVPSFPEDSLFYTLQSAFPERVHHLEGKLGFPDDEETLDLWAEIQNLESPSPSSPSEKEKEPS